MQHVITACDIRLGLHRCYTQIEMWWHTVTHGRGSEGETGKCSGWTVLFTLPRNTVYPALDSSWNVMAHGDVREGKWRGNWRMQWVASTLHTTSEHGVSSITTADAHISAASSPLNWRHPPADLNGLFRFARKTKSGFCACVIIFQTQSNRYLAGHWVTKVSLCFHTGHCILQPHHVTFDICTSLIIRVKYHIL